MFSLVSVFVFVCVHMRELVFKARSLFREEKKKYSSIKTKNNDGKMNVYFHY